MAAKSFLNSSICVWSAIFTSIFIAAFFNLLTPLKDYNLLKVDVLNYYSGFSFYFFYFNSFIIFIQGWDKAPPAESLLAGSATNNFDIKSFTSAETIWNSSCLK